MSATIRLAVEVDAPAVAAIYGPFCETTAVSFESSAPSDEEMARRIRAISAQHPWLVLEDAGAIAGYAYACPHRERPAYDWSADTVVYVDAEYRRRGVGRALYTTLLTLLRLQGYFKAYAGVSLPNPASTGLHEALGFSPIGIYQRVGFKLGAWHDVKWYQLALQEERPNPRAPVPVDAMVGSPGWAAAVANGLRHYSRRGV